VGKPKERYHLEDLGIDGKITLKFVLKQRTERMWTGLVCLRTGTSGRLSGHCGHGDVPLGSLKLKRVPWLSK
jgi:hypothetical protein